MANILVVDDDDSLRRLVVEYFQERRGATVSEARDGADALHEIQTHEVDVVVLDLMMPYMSGIDFLVSLSVLAADPTGADHSRKWPTVVVVTSATPDDFPAEEITRRFPAFVRCVHRKPLDVGDLASCVEKELALRDSTV